ncbi:ethylene-responsive transcription factor 1-like [Iris pallida]|uniref:Ethylene-responsive transcription factor 1-like n=1 Tax=Iris pallida TaxID=29817 RepID=A0AAX6FGX7_IRIPA|nr:ethylene-responsive transcription factor 1-like [Iris pallida]
MTTTRSSKPTSSILSTSRTGSSVKPFTFSSKPPLPLKEGPVTLKPVEFNGAAEKFAKRKRKSNTEESVNVHGESGQRRSETQAKVFECGMELSILLKKLQEHMILKLAGLEAKKQRLWLGE